MILFCIESAIPKLIPLHSQTLTEGSLYRSVCSASAGDKPLFFHWTKNGQKLTNNQKNDYKIENIEELQLSVLTIKSVERSDSGNYSCIVGNAFGEDIKHSQLFVKGFYHFIYL